MRSILIIPLLLLLCLSARSQNWQPGYFYDIKGIKNAGLISVDPPEKGPVADEGFIEYKQDAKADVMKISASELRSFVAGRDSFIVAAEPKEGWGKYSIDFVKVVVDAPTRLFAATGAAGGGGSGFAFEPGIGVGIGGGTGGFGGGIGAGISIPIGGKGRSSGRLRTIYFYGSNTAVMQVLTSQNFIDVMSEVMGDEPEVVEKIQDKQFGLGNINKLIAYFNEVRSKD